MVMILIDALACNRDFTIPSIFGDTVLQNGVDAYQTAESTLFAIPVVEKSKEKISFTIYQKIFYPFPVMS